MPLSVMVYSLLKNSDPGVPAVVYIAHNQGFADSGCCEKLNEIVHRFPFAKAQYCNAEALLEKHRALFETERNKWAPIIWAGPLITEVLPPDVRGNILYLDVDMLVVRDPAPLFDIDLAGRGLVGAAVIEGERSRFKDMEALEWPETAGHYYNNGTLLLDLDRYREKNLSEKILQWYSKYRDVSIRTDQDSQNAVFGADLTKIPVAWNFNDSLLYREFLRRPFAKTLRTHPRREVLEAIVNPGIVHYINRKPWCFSHRPTHELYHRHMKELGFYTPELGGTGFRQKFQLFIYRRLHSAIRVWADLMLRRIRR